MARGQVRGRVVGCSVYGRQQQQCPPNDSRGTIVQGFMIWAGGFKIIYTYCIHSAQVGEGKFN